MSESEDLTEIYINESEDLRDCVDRSVEMLHQRNLELEKENSQLREQNESCKVSIELYRLVSEFWAGECIAEEKKAQVSHMLMFLVSAMAFVAIGKAILSCQ